MDTFSKNNQGDQQLFQQQQKQQQIQVTQEQHKKKHLFWHKPKYGEFVDTQSTLDRTTERYRRLLHNAQDVSGYSMHHVFQSNVTPEWYTKPTLHKHRRNKLKKSQLDYLDEARQERYQRESALHSKTNEQNMAELAKHDDNFMVYDYKTTLQMDVKSEHAAQVQREVELGLRKYNEEDQNLCHRDDVTGVERRARAERYEESVPDSKMKYVEMDAENLYHNKVLDQVLHDRYKPCEYTQEWLPRFQTFSTFKEFDKNVKTSLNRKRQRLADLEKNGESDPYLEEQIKKGSMQVQNFEIFLTRVRAMFQVNCRKLEVDRTKKAAVENALLQLHVDNEYAPSAYYAKMKEYLEQKKAKLDANIDEDIAGAEETELRDVEGRTEEYKATRRRMTAGMQEVLDQIPDLIEARDGLIQAGVPVERAKELFDQSFTLALKEYTLKDYSQADA